VQTSLLALFAEIVGITASDLHARITAWAEAHPDLAPGLAELLAIADRETATEKLLAAFKLGLSELKSALDTGRSVPGEDLSALS
jgi:hypothetical protein